MNTLPPLPDLAGTSAAFKAELCRMAERNGWEPGPIATVMFLEGTKFNPATLNGDTSVPVERRAVGLIQFMPKTAKLLGTTSQALRRMTAVQQLEYVEKYFKMVRLPAGARAGDYYIATFMPSFIGRSDDEAMAVAGELNYEKNKGLDRNKDGLISVGDVRGYLENTLAQYSSKPPLVVDMSATSETSLWPWLLAGGAAWLLRKRIGF